MSKLFLKACRDLWARRWQSAGLIALVAVIVTSTAGSRRAARTLEHTREVWYRQLGLADLEIRCSPALPGVLDGVRAWPELETAEERVLLPGVFRTAATQPLPAIVRMLPEAPPTINRLELLAGRYPAPGEDGAVLDRSLQCAFGLGVGDEIEVVIGERRRSLEVVGVSASPDHLLNPCHPIYRLPLAGTVAVVGVSASAATSLEPTGRVTSLLFRFVPGADAEALQTRLLDELPLTVLEVLPRQEAPTHRTASLIISVFDVYLPAALLVLVGVALTLLVLTLQRTVRRQEPQIGLLLALGHRPWALAAAYLPMAVVPALGGALVGTLNHGWYGRFVSESYTASLGFAPLHDPGPGGELLLASAGCLVLSIVAALVPAYVAARRRPLPLMRPAPAHGREGSAVARAGARLKNLLGLPLSVVIGLGNLWRRRWTSLAAVTALGLAFALVISFVCVHVTYEQETDAATRRLGLDAVVRFGKPVSEDVLAEAARRVNGHAQPTVNALAVLEFPRGPTVHPLICLAPDGWIRNLPVARGRRFTDPRAHEVLVDEYVADVYGLAVGDRFRCYPGLNAPDSVEVEVAGVLAGASMGHVFAPIEVGREIFGLRGLATGMDVASPMAREALVETLRRVPEAEMVMSLDRAREKVGEVYAGLARILVVMVLMAILVAVLFLALLAVLDAADRAPDLAVLGALGWRDRSLLTICTTEVLTRGGLAFLVAIPAAPALAWWLLERLRSANHYRMDLVVPSWVFVAVGVACLVLIPLGALPAWWTARRGSPGRAVRVLASE